MAGTMIEPDDVTATVIAGIDQFLIVIASVRAEQARDPLGRLTDVLLEMRQSVRDGAR